MSVFRSSVASEERFVVPVNVGVEEDNIDCRLNCSPP